MCPKHAEFTFKYLVEINIQNTHKKKLEPVKSNQLLQYTKKKIVDTRLMHNLNF